MIIRKISNDKSRVWIPSSKESVQGETGIGRSILSNNWNKIQKERRERQNEFCRELENCTTWHAERMRPENTDEGKAKTRGGLNLLDHVLHVRWERVDRGAELLQLVFLVVLYHLARVNTSILHAWFSTALHRATPVQRARKSRHSPSTLPSTERWK